MRPPMSEPIDHIEFHLQENGRPGESETDRHTVSAEVLAGVLLRAQQSVYLLALAAKGHEVRHRLRIPSDIKEQFALQCELPEPGSYVQPVGLKSAPDLFGDGPGVSVMANFKDVASALGTGAWDQVQKVVPDSAIRRRLIEEFAGMMPEPGETWTLGIQNGQGEVAFFNSDVSRRVREHVRRLRAPEETVSEPVTIAGELTKIDFAERKFTIRHFPSRRAFDCEYNEDLEQMLVENRRGPIHVSGLVELNEKDEPIRLTDVFEIREVDTSAMVVHDVPLAGNVLRFRGQPRSFDVTLDESGTLFVVEDEELGVHAYAETREALREVLAEELDVVWTEYAAVDADALTPAAARLRARLREVLEVVPLTPRPNA